jgi:hypothetical protein
MPGALAPGGVAGGGGTCPGGDASTIGSIAGDVSISGRRIAPNAVSVMPVNELTDAYIDNMRMAMGSDSDRRRSLNLDHDPRVLQRALYFAMHQADMVASIRYAKTAGSHFTCVGLPPGPYYVLAIVNEAYKPQAPYSGYVANSNRLVFYVARATVAAAARPHAPRKVSIPSKFDMVGATASAM